ncbi:M20 family metallopeptidase [Bacillus sp. JJ1773]|uniref:M20 family metallopeptidase n=1 Tax=Bacillus sp. JJ1773 TaxID=3122965 RepID=UPI002FFD6EA2
MSFSQFVKNAINDKKQQFIEVSDFIWAHPEIRFEEKQSSNAMKDALMKEGFEVQSPVAGLDTGFVASYGSGHPIVAILGEFDALEGLSQKKGTLKNAPIVEGGHGHGCGHNLLGTGSLAAVVAIKEYLQQYKLSGTVRYYGCPAEESGGGKVFMVREGLFNDVDFALSWHPGNYAAPLNMSFLATYTVKFSFEGRSAHAAAAPHLGRSALDAVELMNVGVNFLREHIIPEARIHYAITNAGGDAPNVVQAHADVVYSIRAPKRAQLDEIFERVIDVAKGAALMVSVSMSYKLEGGYSEVIPNSTMANVMYEKIQEIGLPAYTQDEMDFAREIQQTLGDKDIQQNVMQFDFETKEKLLASPIATVIPPLSKTEELMAASTDVGDVSWIVPTMQCNTATWAIGTAPHTWQVVSQGSVSYAQKAMLQAGEIMAATALEIMQSPDILAAAKAEHKKRLGGQTYSAPIPADLQPPKLK